MCCDCSEIEINIGDSGNNGWSPVYANIEDTCTGTDVVVQQLISWIGGTGNKPSYNSNIMTDAWLTANPLYLGDSGWVTVLCNATNILGADGTNGSNGSNGTNGAAGEDGCNPDITFNITAGSEEIACTVTAGSGSTNCEPIFDVNIPDEAFTNTTVIDTITSSEEFATAVTDAVNAILNSNWTSLTFTLGSFNVSGTDSSNITLNSIASQTNYYKILGNVCILTFNIAVSITASSISQAALSIDLPSPIQPTAFANGVYNGSVNGVSLAGGSTFLKPMLADNATGDKTLKFFEHKQFDEILFLSGTKTYNFQGQIIYKI